MLFRDPRVPKGGINLKAEAGVVVLRGQERAIERHHDAWLGAPKGRDGP